MRKTRKRGVASIPELRRSFEHIEAFLRDRIRRKDTKEKIIRDLRKEWRQVFLKPLDKVSAEALYEDAPKGRIRGGAALAGAPLEYTTQPGIYLAQGTVPTAEGGIPTQKGGGPYGSFLQYVSHGFWNPEMAISYDPVKGQPAWPVPYAQTGSNVVGGVRSGRSTRSTRSTRRRVKGGSAGILMHPIPSSQPPTPLQDAQDMWHGKAVGPSPDQVQRTPDYQLGALYPKPFTF